MTKIPAIHRQDCTMNQDLKGCDISLADVECFYFCFLAKPLLGSALGPLFIAAVSVHLNTLYSFHFV